MTAHLTARPAIETRARRHHLIQGDHYISADPDAVISTVLGSCVATCMYDAEAAVGGMNHFLLASEAPDDVAAARYGAYAMEVLINGLLKQGARRGHLRAKLFGGADMVRGLTDIGASNARFARTFLANEDIPVLSDSLGGRMARRVEFWPASGRARQRLIQSTVTEHFAPLARAAAAATAGGDLELF